MRKLTVFLTIILFLTILNSCDNGFNIFSDEGEEVTIVYGYLDVAADTNYLKITKSFTGNAVELAPDSFMIRIAEFKASFELPWYVPKGKSTTTKERFTARHTDDA